MKNLLYLAGVASAMRSGTHPDDSPSPMASTKIDWNNPYGRTANSDAAILAHSMIAASIARGWKGDPRWRAQGLHQNPARLWRFLEALHGDVV